MINFDYQTQVDGTPFIVVRFKDNESIEKIPNKRFFIYGKLYTTDELDELDKILNAYDQTTLFLLAEKRLTMKTGDLFILLIWATVNKPTKFMEGIHVLKSLFSTRFR